MNTNKMAAQDAVEYARAQVFYGEGAGVRRRLIDNTVAWNSAHVPGYSKAFDEALGRQNWADHATKAVRERKAIDRGKTIKRNARGILTGNRRNMTAGVGSALVIYAYLRETGLDKDIRDETKQAFVKVKVWTQVKSSYIRAKFAEKT